MTQEELDALMNGSDDLDLDSVETKEEKPETDYEDEEKNKKMVDDMMSGDYKARADMAWPPPPPSKEHKVVHQLDDVTRDSEIKATEMMEKLEAINDFFANSENDLCVISDALNKNIDIFEKLNAKFPNVASFKEAIDTNNNAKNIIDEITGCLQTGQDEVMMAMDAMQYQDIHRQKIERVINVMRALSRYMSSLFEGKIDDEKRVGSAVHIEGDTTADVVSNDDIEALIASLGKK
ncbi:chemotaxis protein [Campylobacter volucris]|uniref:chemotaxis protein n=1 Tax=Campylobacter volucris TaxID=1031542 RepID=UPI00105A55CE|nr:chemotaxis protein [Campylobacter volucris]MBF7043148.1 chemotaxis protein [Campylobacter volucris]MBF7044057.1 chemotaxis protein [Campylobacter volucris]MBF7045097.1 chemotaxis protein [Campylobacter volucris]MBF7046542.1 chemotaxis protein [Campylobacter volucris]MBF7068074.1 chemotaxis protein [Campylobacter volucris]